MAVDKLVDSTQLDSGLTSVANAIRTKGGTSASLSFPAGFVSAVEAIPTGGGGGGPTTVASGTFTGDGGHQITIPIGKKCPQTDFLFFVWAAVGTEYPYDSKYKVARLVSAFPKEFLSFDLSSDGEKTPISTLSYDINNGGTITNKSINFAAQNSIQLQNNSIQSADFQAQRTRIIRASTGFSIFFNVSNAAYQFLSGATYNWKLVYYGASPSTDIVEVS